jgi:hypothetical protein
VTFYDGSGVLATEALSAGSASYTTTTLTQATHSISVGYTGDTKNAPSTSSTLMQSVVAAPTLASFSVSGYNSPAIPGEGSTVTVQALSSGGGVLTSYTGTVTLSSSDSAATLPAAYTFTASDAGSHAFPVTLNTRGTQSITATSGSVSGSQSGILVGDAIWALNTTGTLVKLNRGGGSVASGVGTSGSASTRGGVAFDSAGDAWSVSSGSNTLNFVTYLGLSGTAYTGGGLSAPTAVAVDGAGKVWVANGGNNTVSEFSNAGVAVSSSSGFAENFLSAPSSIAIDAAGGVWIANHGSNSVTHVFGAATAVKTPLATAVVNGTEGKKP